MNEEIKKKIKGISLKHLFSWIQNKYGQEQWERFCSHIDDDDKDFISDEYDKLEWYDFDIYIKYLKLLKRILKVKDDDLIQLGKYSAEDSFNTFYSFLVKLFSLSIAVDRAPLFWRRYHDFGTIEVVWEGKEKVKIYVLKCSSFPDIYLNVIKGWVLKTLEIAGARNFKTDVRKCIYAAHDAICIAISRI